MSRPQRPLRSPWKHGHQQNVGGQRLVRRPGAPPAADRRTSLSVAYFWPVEGIRHTSGISGGFRQLRIYVSAVMADFETFVMRPKEDTARDKLIPRKLVRQSRGDTKEEDVICYHSAHCRQILSIKTPLSSPSNSRII